MPLIDAAGLEKLYRLGRVDVAALRGVDVTVERGEYVAIMGPSGSGKSTLMHILGCLDWPTSGSYVLDGEDVSGLRGRALARVRNRKVGFVFQTFNLMPRMTIDENVALPLQYRGGVTRRDRLRRARALLGRFGLDPRIGHRPDELSGGERQRVAVAGALAARPRIAVLDEPTSHQDEAHAELVVAAVVAAARRGMAVVVASHDPVLVAAADHVLSLDA